jgi:hypothetical protein
MPSKVVPATLASSALLAATIALSATFAAPASASDNCRRLPSASLIILVPEGGCNVTDPDKQPKVPDDVTVIRGSAPIARSSAKTEQAGTSRRQVAGGPLVIVVNQGVIVRDRGVIFIPNKGL